MPEKFDLSRARLAGKAIFPPFKVSQRQMHSLQQSISGGRVSAQQVLLAAQISSGVIVLDPAQMTFHHVAQGELAGQPWMVSF